jgi:transposase
MGPSRRRFTRELKIEAVERIQSGTSVAEVARFFKVDPNVLRRWRRDFLRFPETAFPGSGRTPEQSRVARLQQHIERHCREIESLNERLRKIESAIGSNAVTTSPRHEGVNSCVIPEDAPGAGQR